MSEHPSFGVLEGVFRELLARHIRLGVRDYLDAVRAIRLGFGGHTKNELRLFCRRLWGRNERELRTIDAVFALIPAAEVDQGAELDRLIDLAGEADEGAGKLIQTGERQLMPSTNGLHSRVFFGGADGQDGLALPPLNLSSRTWERFIYNPQTVISQRELAVVWRRLRKLTRTGPRLELDVQSTIRERCHSGVLARPVLRPYRRNTARLLVLVDVSPSMAPWRPFIQTLVDSACARTVARCRNVLFLEFSKEMDFSKLGPAGANFIGGDIAAECGGRSADRQRRRCRARSF